MTKYRLSQFVAPGDCFHLARVHVGQRNAISLHTHDFPEVFWIERGSGSHAVNGSVHPLTTGELILMRPADQHGFRTQQGMVLVNLAFEAESLEFFRGRYFTGGDPWPWQGGDMPARFRLTRARMLDLAERIDLLATLTQRRLDLECFLIHLLQALVEPVVAQSLPSFATELPRWLRDAIAGFRDPQKLAGGLQEFERLAGRCPEHVNRVIRRTMEMTTTDFVNGIRLDHAARRLAMSNLSVLDVAMESGFENLGYFYRLFSRRFGAPPRRFRRDKQSVVLSQSNAVSNEK